LGREAIVEVLDIDDAVRELIYEGTLTQLHRYLRETNFASFRVAAIEKVTSGLTTVEEVLRVIPRSALYSNLLTTDRMRLKSVSASETRN
jgi:type II secretory ATPase GspE/PulE/Tfp pilus assembly ATPase PilB-like protein